MNPHDEFLELLPEGIKNKIKNQKEIQELGHALTRHMSQLKASGEVIDKFPCYSLFLKYFLSYDMRKDFLAEAKNFIKANFKKLGKFHAIRYVSEDFSNSLPDTMFYTRILNCIMNAAVAGDKSARAIFVSLYKKYYKKEYNQIKRYHTITEKDLIEQADFNADGKEMSINISRLIVMSEFLEKELDESVDRLRLLLHDVLLTDEENCSYPITYCNYSEESDELPSRHDCFWEFRELLAGEDEDYKDDCNFHHLKLWEFHKLTLNQHGFNDDHMLERYMDDYNADHVYAEVLYLLRRLGETRSYEYHELQEYAMMYILTSAYCDTMQVIDRDINEFMLLNYITDDDETPDFVNKPSANKSQVSAISSNTENDVLRKQIEQLQQELHKKEQDEAYIRSLYEDEKKKKKDVELRLMQYEQDREELLALRDHVYNMTEQDAPAISASIADMISSVKDIPVAIIGGNQNWINKMKAVFPGFKYIRVKESSAISDTVVDNVRKVFFFTDTLSHCTYTRFMNIIIKKEIPFGYIHTVNMNAIIKQLYEDMIES